MEIPAYLELLSGLYEYRFFLLCPLLLLWLAGACFLFILRKKEIMEKAGKFLVKEELNGILFLRYQRI